INPGFRPRRRRRDPRPSPRIPGLGQGDCQRRDYQPTGTGPGGRPGSGSRPGMADQATMRPESLAAARRSAVPIGAADAATGNGQEPGTGNVVSNVAGFGENLLTLAELQTRLTALELQQNLSAARISVPVILAGVVLAVVSLPLILAGIAELLVSDLGM